MPYHLFVVVFPRKVQAHTVVVQKRKEKPKHKWSVGGLRSPPSFFLGSISGDRRKADGKDDDRSGPGAAAHAAKNWAAAAITSNSGSTSRSAASSRDEGLNDVASLSNQETVRIQLSRPTDEVEPDNRGNNKNNNNDNHGGDGGSTHSKGRSSRKDSAPSKHDAAKSVSRSQRGCPAVEEFEHGGWDDPDKRAKELAQNATCQEDGVEARKAVGQKWRERAAAAKPDSSSRQENSRDDDIDRNKDGKKQYGIASKRDHDNNENHSSAEECKDEQSNRSSHDDDGCGVEAAPVPSKQKDGGDRSGSVGSSSVRDSRLSGVNEHGESDEDRGEAAGSQREDGEEKSENNLLQMFHEGKRRFMASDGRELRVRQKSNTGDEPNNKSEVEVTEVLGDDDVDQSKPAKDADEGEEVDIEGLVRSILMEVRGDRLLIGEPTYHVSAGGKLMTCIFPCAGEESHLILTKLESVGVGSECGSVNVLPMEIGRSDITRRKEREKSESDAAKLLHNSKPDQATAAKSSIGSDNEEEARRRAYDKFRALASQIRVTQVTEEIREGTQFHFDYAALLIASSIISAMGLATNNVAVVVAAMLVSPIMGPVLAFTFGTNVHDWALAKQGFLVECFSLLICVAVGFVVGVVGTFFINEDTWPTDEMESRGVLWGLATGLVISIPSGMAVALSILSKNVNSLVGVAISASLLPPAVNTGLCLAIALLGPQVVEFDVDGLYFVVIGLISMALTIVNIGGIYIAGVSLFVFKEVAPLKPENSCWSKDMIHARKFQQKLGKSKEGGEAAFNLRQQLMEAARKGAGEAHGKRQAGEEMDSQRKASFSSAMDSHHRYRHKDRRRRPTVFDLFGDAFVAGDASPTIDPAVGDETTIRESLKAETGGLKGLMAKLFEGGHSDDGGNSNETGGEASERVNRSSTTRMSKKWKNLQSMLTGTSEEPKSERSSLGGNSAMRETEDEGADN